MTIDISKIKPGDKVTLVPLEVSRANPLSIMVSLPGGGGYSITPDQIVAHHPAPREFQMGDRVRLIGGTKRGTVCGAYQDEVWVKWDNSPHPEIRLAPNLTLAEAGQ